MPEGMRTVHERAQKTGFLTGAGHPIAKRAAGSSTAAEMPGASGPPNFRDAAEGEGSCASCRDFLGDEDDAGKCNRYGVATAGEKACDAFAELEAAGEDEPAEMIGEEVA